MTKVLLAAAIMAAALPGTASAMEAQTFTFFAGASEPSLVQNAYWIGRYGQPCFHGPVWLPECHATDTPGIWIPGHWNAMRTAWIPGHYE